jgi:hypothetical protein
MVVPTIHKANLNGISDAYHNSSLVVFPDIPLAHSEYDGHCGEIYRGCFRHIARSRLYQIEKPFYLNLPLPPGQPDTNFVGTTYEDIKIQNVRGIESCFSLDVHGFEYCALEKLQIGLDDKAQIEDDYLRSVSTFLKTKFDTEHVYVFDYTVSSFEHTVLCVA